MTTITEQLIKGARIKGYIDETYKEGQEFTGIFFAQIKNVDVTIVDKFPAQYNTNINATVTILETEIELLNDSINELRELTKQLTTAKNNNSDVNDILKQINTYKSENVYNDTLLNYESKLKKIKDLISLTA
jgi:cell shape-determining protein MreC